MTVSAGEGNVIADIEAERALLARIQAGDKAACAECIEQHSADVYRLALRLMRNEAEAEDVVQETFVSAFKGIERFEGQSRLSTWLYRIAHNVALMRLRRVQPVLVSVDEPVSGAGGTEAPRELFDWCCLPEQDFDTAEAHAQLEGAIAGLPENLRMVFVLREMEGLSTEAAAELLGLSVDNVKTRLHRARLRLRERLSEYFVERTPATNGH
jgi:RNA polymerase sigma-70 factor (ECF subfamily)